MQIQQINACNNGKNPVFSSKLVPTNTLRDAFDHAVEVEDVKFLNAVKNILNDGKNNKIRIDSYRDFSFPPSDEYVETKLYVNDKQIDYLDNIWSPPYIDEKNVSTGNRVLDAIKLLVRNFTDKNKVQEELSDIYKKNNLAEGDTRGIADSAPRFF